MEDFHAANGFDTDVWGSILSYENMLETVLTVFNAHTNAYEVIMDSIQSAEGYEEVRDRLKEKYRILQSKKEATKIVDKQKAAATKARKLKIAQITMEDDNICRKCGGEGHWANDPTCPKFFQNWPRAGKDGGGKGKGQGKGKVCANNGSLQGPAANHKPALPSEYGLRTGIRGMGVGTVPGFGPGCEFLSQPLLSNRRSQLFCLITRSTVHCTTILLHLFRWLLPRIPRRVALAPSDVQYDPGIGLMLLMPLLWACRLPVAGAGAG